MNLLVAGGAGFIGSHIVGKLCENGHSVTVVDGMMSETSGTRDNLAHLNGYRLHDEPVESYGQLSEILSTTDMVIDCMGWTRHLLALENPEYDLRLNVLSHLTLIRALKASPCKKVVYLGSRGQIGNASSNQIDDDAPRLPLDVQGIHKTAAESHYRVFARLSEAKVLSLIIGNTFGPRMPMDGPDIGLVGGFLRDVLADRGLELYGRGRTREFTFAPDLAEMIARLCQHDWEGFQSLNIPGSSMTLEELVETMIDLAGSGRYSLKDWPAELKAIDIGAAKLCPRKIEAWLGKIHSTPMRMALQETIQTLRS